MGLVGEGHQEHQGGWLSLTSRHQPARLWGRRERQSPCSSSLGECYYLTWPAKEETEDGIRGDYQFPRGLTRAGGVD